MGIVLSEKLNRRKKSRGIGDFIDLDNIYITVFGFFSLIILILGLIYFSYKIFFLSNFDNLLKSIVDYNKLEIIINGNGDIENFKGLNYQEDFLKDVEKKVKIISEERQKELVGRLNFALPDILEKEFVIKFFEDLFLTISSKNSPVILNSINIGSPTLNNAKIGNSDNIVYKKYPISLGFSCSDKEFDRILDIIQVSGLFDKRYYFRGEILPVMTVSSVTMNFDKNINNDDSDSEKIDDSLKSRSLQIFMYSYGDEKKGIKK